MKTRVLILHTSVGYGIKMVAQNIHDKLVASHQFDVRIEDIQKVESGAFTRILEKVYLFIHEKLSFVWGFLYHSKIVLAFILPLRKFVASFKSKRVLKILREFQPAMVISTQTVASGIIAYLKSKGLYRGKLVIVFSDYHLHRFWLYDEADLYLCNIAEQVEELRRLGVSEEKIALTGMLIADKYLQPIFKEQACDTFGLLKSMPVVLISGGSRGLLNSKEIFLSLLRSPRSFQVAVVTGKNEELRSQLLKISAPARHPIKILGFVDNQDVLMSAANVLIGKVGGPTIAEAVAKRLAIILTSPHPGHEEINLEYLVRNQIVAFGRIPREVAFLAEQYLDQQMSFNNALRMSKLIKPPGSLGLMEALERVRPKSQLVVQNYQPR